MPAPPDELRSLAAKLRRWARASADPAIAAEMEKLAAELEAIAERRSRDGQGAADR